MRQFFFLGHCMTLMLYDIAPEIWRVMIASPHRSPCRETENAADFPSPKRALEPGLALEDAGDRTSIVNLPPPKRGAVLDRVGPLFPDTRSDRNRCVKPCITARAACRPALAARDSACAPPSRGACGRMGRFHVPR